MPRIRTIKPEFWTDEKVGKLKRDERLLFIGLWNIADDQGVVKSNPAYIKGQLFSYDEELRISTVKEWLASLAEARMLVPFAYNGESYYIIRTFEEHQLINRPSKPKFPEEMIKNLLQEDSQNTHGIFSEGSQHEGKGREEEKEGNGTGEGESRPPPEKKERSIPHLFRNSEFFEKKIFCAALEKTQYAAANLDYYHEVILNWSDGKDEKRSNWLATAKKWMATDMVEGKFITKDFQPAQYGKQQTPKTNGNGQPGAKVTGEQINTAFAEFHKPR